MRVAKSPSVALKHLPTNELKLAKTTVKKQLKKTTIQLPLTVGERLRKAREKLGLDLLAAEQKTLIRAKYLEALETAKFYQLPSSVYVYGFVQTYASFLGLSPKKILAQFREEYGLANRQSVNHLTFESTVKESRMIVTPKLFWTGLFGSLLVAFVGYLGFQVYNFSGIPMLTVDSPAASAQVSTDTVTVAGSTEPGVAVKIGSELVPVDEEGRYVQNVHVEEGTNTVLVTARSRSGKERTITRSFNVTAPRTTLAPNGNGAYE